jgi:ubiquinone/menaquinone biosynthesis C-methylase UbiE
MAAVYDRIAARLQFTAPGHDLVEVAGVSAGDAVLDAGTGTGVVAAAARTVAGPTGFVLGVDSAFEMIRYAPKEACTLVLGQMPMLPFRDDAFDAVLAGFVVTHFQNYRAGLAEMTRVCRAGGRVAMSVWGNTANAPAALWTDTAAHYLDREQLLNDFLKQIPWDTWFSRIENVSRALEMAGLASVSTQTRHYPVRMQTNEYLLSREASVQGLVLRNRLSASDWDHFTADVSQAFHDKFGAIVEYLRDVHFGVGVHVLEKR